MKTCSAIASMSGGIEVGDQLAQLLRPAVGVAAVRLLVRVVRQLSERVKAGAIVLLHEDETVPTAVDAMRMIMPVLRSRGLLAAGAVGTVAVMTTYPEQAIDTHRAVVVQLDQAPR